MDKINYDTIIETLHQKFPEYRRSSYYDELNDRLPYVVLGNITLMAFDKIDQRKDSALAERLVMFADEIFNSRGISDDVVNLFAVQVLEVLTVSKTGAELARNFLHGKSINLLERVIKHYSTDVFLEEYKKNIQT